jgi:hypothetical protein
MAPKHSAFNGKVLVRGDYNTSVRRPKGLLILGGAAQPLLQESGRLSWPTG